MGAQDPDASSRGVKPLSAEGAVDKHGEGDGSRCALPPCQRGNREPRFAQQDSPLGQGGLRSFRRESPTLRGPGERGVTGSL